MHFFLMGISQCQQTDDDGDDWSVEQGDCNDADPTIHPGAEEICDGVDQDCNDQIDEGVSTTYYKDADLDGYGMSSSTVKACEQPEGYTTRGGDCNDGDATANPGALEVCDAVDNNCNNQVDEGVKTLYYIDSDGDGYGNNQSSTQACSQPDGYISVGGDCNDADIAINPGATETCDGVDQDCDNQTDNGVSTTYYADADADGYGNPNSTTQACNQPDGYTTDNTDCLDNNAAAYPGATESCDGLDNNCDGTVDEGLTTPYYQDLDADGYGNPNVVRQACVAPTGFVPTGGDCNDNNNTIYPGAPEQPNTIDDDCDGAVDEGLSTRDVAAGAFFTLALKYNGTVWAWGDNGFGQLGDGTYTERTEPVQVSGLTEVTYIAAGDDFSLALRRDGTVWAWGYNGYGQLGDGSTTTRIIPVKIASLSNVVAIGAGGFHGLAVLADGTVKAWGRNNNGQLGDNSTSTRTTPITVTGLTNVTQIAGGYLHSLARRNDGTVYAWGDNQYGQIGDGTITDRKLAVQVTGLTNASMVEAGDESSYALLNDGVLKAWGNNYDGQLGDGTNTSRSNPVTVSGLTSVKSIGAGSYHALAVKADGSAWSWGWNAYGQLGDNSTVSRSSPGRVSSLNGATFMDGGFIHSTSQKSDGTVWSWGDGAYGQIGDGTYNSTLVPVQTHNVP